MEKMKKARKHLAGWLLFLPFLLCILYTLWMPTVQGVIWSFFEMKGYTPVEFAGFQNYRIIMSDTGFMRTLFNTLLYVFWSLIIGFWVPFVLAVMLNEVIRGKGFFRFAMYLPSMAPGIAISMLWYYMYYPNGSGLLNMLLGWFGVEPKTWLQNSGMTIPLILISSTWKSMGGTLLLYLAALQGVSRELYEAALVDGAGPWRIWASIYVPLAKPSIATITLFTIVGYWNEFFQGLVLSTKEASYPLQTYIQQMVVTLDYSTMNAEQIAAASKLNNQSLDAAKIFIAMVPVLIVYPFLQKYFVKGITLGSVKG